LSVHKSCDNATGQHLLFVTNKGIRIYFCYAIVISHVHRMFAKRKIAYSACLSLAMDFGFSENCQ